ncbi:MAG: TIGR04282 family arsenosugar biosynthesis glycosyltransferase [Alphaproteobacteria bacterium]|nr:TIGR04282 family arsenosugar biosynthesis glycosyltransferase [Alphaproteobacteria bacterium]
MRRTLIIFARAPRLGVVKKRLAAEIGDVEARRVYETLLRETVRRLAADRRWRTEVVATRESYRWPRHLPRRDQARGGLGRRMAEALRGAPPGPAVLVGTDIPDLAPRHVERAFRALGSNKLVFGPAADGGYWLVGVRDRKALAGLFRGVRWSTRHALADTLANIRPGVSHALVDTLADLDEAKDLR